MNARSAVFVLFAFAAGGIASPNPSPIDPGIARVIAVNNNLACSTGTCNATTLETNSSSSEPVSYTSGACVRQDSWSPFTLFAAGGLALSTGML